MAQIRLIQPGQPVADFAVSGTTVTIAGLTLELADHQQDASVTLEVRSQAGTARLGGDGAYLAHIELPPARYDHSAGEPTRQPLDPHTVVLTLWPTP